ncbi:hypothetical protein QAD02_023649 [Eretmocerus hayati]|uniref:Uncharacterized protein n=1 Tax=Eretmocerus hayati TaxID=131215 RepID=A0ACC2PX51_9HYME|nr:hypothetical protein QAD02_023649 [Eretmocerus hayati]
MTTEEKFKAAVNVIRNLPKNGAYQPSNELMLKFYSFYKQATEGPCKDPKPGFWEVVKKAKWAAWKSLTDMSREEAMINYVEELKKIVETMSYNENVANFMDSFDAFYESVPIDDLELVVGPIMDRLRSQSGGALTPLGSREASPIRRSDATIHNNFSHLEATSDNLNVSSGNGETETEDEFIDTVESVPGVFQDRSSKIWNDQDHFGNQLVRQEPMSEVNYAYVNGGSEPIKYNDVPGDTKKLKHGVSMDPGISDVNSDFINQIAITLRSLQKDLDQVMIRVANIERQVLLLTKNRVNSSHGQSEFNKWPIPRSTRVFALIILWPFVIHLFIYLFKYHNRHKA